MRSAFFTWRRALLTAALFFVVAVLLALSSAQNVAKPASADLPPGSPALLQPEDLVKTLQAGRAKPVVLYVGPKFLYAQAHIPGAEFIGPAGDAQSLDRLRTRAAALPKSSAIVLYCGCCPWEHCPNIRPAYHELQKMGFKNVKALYLATSFGANWVEKNYPVEKGEPRS